MGLAFLLWRKAGWFAAHLILATRAESAEARPALGEFQAVALSVLGAFVLTQALPWGAEVGVSLLIDGRNRGWDYAREILAHPPSMARLASLAMQLLLGVGLFLGGRGVVGMLKAVRAAGLPQPPDRAD
jgi:hypothetical protein